MSWWTHYKDNYGGAIFKTPKIIGQSKLFGAKHGRIRYIGSGDANLADVQARQIRKELVYHLPGHVSLKDIPKHGVVLYSPQQPQPVGIFALMQPAPAQPQQQAAGLFSQRQHAPATPQQQAAGLFPQRQPAPVPPQQAAALRQPAPHQPVQLFPGASYSPRAAEFWRLPYTTPSHPPSLPKLKPKFLDMSHLK